MSSPVGPEGITLSQPVPVPTLTVLPPSSDTESWSRSPSPRLARSSRHGRFHRSRTRTKKSRNEEEQGCSPKRQWGKTVVMEETTEKGKFRRRSPSPSAAGHSEGGELGQDSPSQDLLLPPSRSWSRSPSPSRRSRWSLRSLLSKDSDWDSCRLVCWLHPSNRLKEHEARDNEEKYLSSAFTSFIHSADRFLFVNRLTYLTAAHQGHWLRTERPHQQRCTCLSHGHSVLKAS